MFEHDNEEDFDETLNQLNKKLREIKEKIKDLDLDDSDPMVEDFKEGLDEASKLFKEVFDNYQEEGEMKEKNLEKLAKFEKILDKLEKRKDDF